MSDEENRILREAQGRALVEFFGQRVKAIAKEKDIPSEEAAIVVLISLVATEHAFRRQAEDELEKLRERVAVLEANVEAVARDDRRRL